jgi:HK97 family phage major capsid protein
MKTIPELRTELAAKRQQLAKIFEEAGPNLDMALVKTIEGDSLAKATEIKRRNQEIGDLAKELEERQGIADIQSANQQQLEEDRRPANGSRLPAPHNGGGMEPIKSLRSLLADSKEYGAFRAGAVKTAMIHIPEVTVDREFKTLMTLTTINNLATRLPGIQESAQEQITVSDLLLQGTTDNNAISYMVETPFTNAATEVAEGGTKPESALAFTERTDSVRKIATWIPATDELLADVSGIESYIRGRLAFMIERRREQQILTGDGIAPNIQGIMNRTGVQTQAKGADPTPDAVYKAMVLIMVNGMADPTAVVFHPLDWQDVRLLRTADGIYIWGSPADIGPDRIWGLPVRKTTAMTQNTALVGAFTPHAQLFRRSGIDITISTEHSTYFVENKVAILAEERVALAVYRPAAFCTVTGI